MNKDLNAVLLQHGLIKLGAQSDMVKTAIYGALLRTLPGLVRAGARYLPSRGIQGVQGAGRGIARWFSNLGKAKPTVPANVPGQLALPAGPPTITMSAGGLGDIGKAKEFLKARQAYQSAKSDTVKAWKSLNPFARGVLKYPYQAALGYGLGIPTGTVGTLASMGGGLANQAAAGREGAAQALTAVDKQLANYQNQLANMGLLDRLGMAAGVAFNPSLAPKALGGARTELQQQIEKLTGKPFQAPTVAQ